MARNRDAFSDLEFEGEGKYRDRNTQVLREERATELDARIKKFYAKEHTVAWAQSVEDFCRQETVQNEDVFELSLEAHRLPKMKKEAELILQRYAQEQAEAKRLAEEAARAEAARLAEEKRKAALAAAEEAARIAEQKRLAEKAAKEAAAAKVLADAQAIDKTVEALAQAPRSRYWCDEVKQTDADFKALPRESRILCKKLPILEQLLKEVIAVEASVAFDNKILLLDKEKKRDATWTNAVRELYKKLTPDLRKYLSELKTLETLYKKTYAIEREPIYGPYQKCLSAIESSKGPQESARKEYADLESKRKSVPFDLGDYISDFAKRWSAAGEAVAQENRRVKAEQEEKRLSDFVRAMTVSLEQVESANLSADVRKTFHDLAKKYPTFQAKEVANRIPNFQSRFAAAKTAVERADAEARAQEEARRRAEEARRARARRRQARIDAWLMVGKIALIVLAIAAGVAAIAIPAAIFEGARHWIIGGALIAVALFVRCILTAILDWEFPKWLNGILFWASLIATGVSLSLSTNNESAPIYAVCLGAVSLLFSPVGLSIYTLVEEGFSDWHGEMHYYYSYEGALFTYDFITYLLSATLLTIAVHFFAASVLATVITAAVAAVLAVLILSFFVDMDGAGRLIGTLLGIAAIAALIIVPIVAFENASAWIVGLLMIALALFLRHALPKMKDWEFPTWLSVTVGWLLLLAAFICLIRRSAVPDGNVWALCTSLASLAWGPMGAGLVCLFTSGLEDWVDDMQDPYDYEGGLFASDCVVYFTTVIFTLILVGTLATTAVIVATVFLITFFSLMLLVFCYDDWDEEAATLTVNVLATLTALVLLFCGRGATLCAIAILVATAIVNLIVWKTTNSFLLGLADEPDAVSALVSFIALVVCVLVLVWGYGFDDFKIKDGVLVKCYSNEEVIDLSSEEFDHVERIDNKAFKKRKNLKELILPNYVEQIGSEAFYECKDLESITIPDSVYAIGNSAFYGCTSLAEIDLPDNLDRINDYTFYSCTSLETIDIPNDVTTVGKYSFAYTSALEEVELYGVERIESHAFDYSGVKDVYLYSELEYIGYTVFRGDVERTIHYSNYDWRDINTDTWGSQEWYHKADVVVYDRYGKESYGN